TDTTYWNSKLDEFTETDPIFLAHPSSSITEDNIEEWKDVWTRYTDNEDDYLAQNSPAGDILLDDITFWNSRPVVYTESDPVFTNSLAFSITQEDSTNLANLLGINTGDQAMDDYATKANFSDDSIKVLTDSIDGFRIALIDSAYDFHIVLDDSIVNFRSALIDSAYDNFHLALKDSMADFREEVSDSINDFRIALRDSMASFRENDLTDSTKQIRKAFNDSITQIFTPALNDSIADLRDEIPVTVGLSIGDEYGGGIIFWLDDSGIHGLIAATSDLPGKVSWGDNTITTDATADGVYAGMSNTDSIIAKQGAADYAVDRCANYSVTTLTTPPEYYDDWYLPSKHELSLLYVQKDVVGGFIVNADISYWTSTEHDVGNAWEQVFRTGTQQTYGKWYTGGNRTRAIRAF
ncbi:MAG: DUF1566 domain-containing protein, partial [candidate division Zixibacteria bacterium]|nr:DUF1566 domain-containing protein [candidate division Zixibacteria bacterium]